MPKVLSTDDDDFGAIFGIAIGIKTVYRPFYDALSSLLAPKRPHSRCLLLVKIHTSSPSIFSLIKKKTDCKAALSLVPITTPCGDALL